ncbi:hypothetical protein K466DRAFT_173015 [Polyporus arcularius HHB13444]|uniref:Uncharacterized protein n=1 Tax=Polyporus arcularius HHB13444 TaxID=1314778 RepID=A0A5C3PAF2_9APHY|nr:hypothetical protein K466DRAFT_173015 [Polyporus arcularius HHB13444]
MKFATAKKTREDGPAVAECLFQCAGFLLEYGARQTPSHCRTPGHVLSPCRRASLTIVHLSCSSSFRSLLDDLRSLPNTKQASPPLDVRHTRENDATFAHGQSAAQGEPRILEEDPCRAAGTLARYQVKANTRTHAQELGLSSRCPLPRSPVAAVFPQQYGDCYVTPGDAPVTALNSMVSGCLPEQTTPLHC